MYWFFYSNQSFVVDSICMACERITNENAKVSFLIKLSFPLLRKKQLQPNTLRLLMLGFLSLKSSYGVFFKMGLISTLVICLEHPLSKYQSCFLSSKISYKKDFQVHRFGPLMNVGPPGLYSSIQALFFLGIHFISPLGTACFLFYKIAQNDLFSCNRSM